MLTRLDLVSGSPYELDPSTLHFGNGQLTGILLKKLAAGTSVELPIIVSFLESGATRITIDEAKRMAEETEIQSDKVNKKRYHEAEKWTIVGGLELSKSAILDP